MLRKKHRVPLHGKPNGYVEIESGATEGAVVGVNVWNQDGTLFVPAAGSSTDAGGTHTYWRLILEIPPNVVALAETATTGLYVITGDGSSATRAIQPVAGETTVSNGDGVAGNPVVGLADVADSGSGALLAITRDAKGRVSGTKNATITGTAGQIEVADGDAIAGLPTISLADVTPTPGGTLQRYGFDAKGRRIEEEAADTDDLSEGSTNLYFTAARADARITAQKGQPNGLATLDADAKLEANQLPALAITDTFVVNTEAAMLALDAQQGDVAVRTDEQKSYILTADPASTLGNWQELLTPTGTGGTVTSVALSVPTGLTVSGSPITTSGTITVNYDTGYQGYTSAEASKLSGIEAGATVGADWSVNLSNIPANITSWAGISPSDVVPSTVAPNLPGTNWDTQSKVGFFRAHSSYGGTSPGLSGDYDVIQTFGSNGDGAQLAFYSGLQAFWRVQDAGPGTWWPWNEFWHTGNLSILSGSKTWDPASVAVGSSLTTTVAVSGAVMGDIVVASFTNNLQGMTLSAYVSSAGTVTVVLTNNTASAINLASGTLKAMVIRA